MATGKSSDEGAGVAEGEEQPPMLVDSVLRHAVVRPEKVCFRWLESGLRETRSVTFGELARRAGAIAHALVQQWGAKRGDRVLLIYAPGLDFPIAFVGCLMAGIIAVPCKWVM